MLDKTYKNPVYKEITAELTKQEPTFNGEIYNFDELIKQEKVLKIVEFIKNIKILILENNTGKKIVIKLIKGEKKYFSSVVNINTQQNQFNINNQKKYSFDEVYGFNQIISKQEINLLSPFKKEIKEIKLNYFIGKVDGKVSYIISDPQGYKHFLVNNYNLESNFTGKKLPNIEEFLLEK